MSLDLAAALGETPVIAILRGLRPNEAETIGDALAAAGVRALEVPLNSPEPLESVRLLSKTLKDRVVVGAGTVLTAADVAKVREAGGRFVVSPNADAAVIEHTLKAGLGSLPGVATATEAFAAVAAGAARLKLFPASTYGPGHLKALADVLPRKIEVFAVGGVGVDDLAAWRDAGAAGVGVGSHIFRPGATAAETAARAEAFIMRAKEIWRPVPADQTAR